MGKAASLKVRCQGDGTVGQFTGLSVVLASLEGRIYREVAAVLPIPSSVKSIQDLFNEVPHNLEYADKLFVYMLPKSLLGGAYAQFETNAKFTPSEFSQVSVDIVDSLEDALAEKKNISKSGVSFNYYIAACLTVPTPGLLAQFYGIGPEVSSSVDFMLPIFDNDDNEYFFGLGDVIQRIKSLWAPQIRSSEPRRRCTLTAIQAPGLPIFCIPARRKPVVAKSVLLEMQSYLFPSPALTVMVGGAVCIGSRFSVKKIA